MKVSCERLVEDEMFLLRKLNTIKNIKYTGEMKDEHHFENDLTVLFKNDFVEFRLDMFLNYDLRNKMKFEIKSFKQIQNPHEFINTFIQDFEWKEGISYRDFFIKFQKEFDENFIKRNLLFSEIICSKTNQENISEIFTSSKYFLQITLIIHLISILLKFATGLYGYSGQSDPPKYGDYEAQRHWMEMTLNLNVRDWYTNSTSNPADYWPLDYPPISGYYSLLWGYFFNLTIPDSVELKDSWGYESPLHKSLMRVSVLISDLLFYHIPVFILLRSILKSNRNHINYYMSSFLFLCSPLFIIIDHGHFQYNCVMHGLFILAVYFIYKKYFILSILSYAICVNFKQMGFYYALPFPFFVIKYLYDEVKNFNHFKRLAIIFLSILKYAMYTILFFLLIWGPWIIYDHKYKDVLLRIFPIWRGIFEDKVATFWCTLNIIYKIKNLPHDKIVLFSLILTLLFSLISCFSLLIYKKASKKVTNLAFFNVSMSFFLFSFHVHEKTILIPYLAYLLNFIEIPEILPSFTLISLFSLHSLLKRENQDISYFIFVIFSFILAKYFNKKLLSRNKEQKSHRIVNWFDIFLSWMEKVNLVIVIFYHYMELIVPPPLKYPWLYPTLNASYSFLNFSLFYLFTNIKMVELLLRHEDKTKLIKLE